MSWDRGKYYTRSKRVNGRVVREYVGTGCVADLAALIDRMRRLLRERERTAISTLREAGEKLQHSVREVNDLASLVAHAALVATGFHQHKRGTWRKRRGKPDEV